MLFFATTWSKSQPTDKTALHSHARDQCFSGCSKSVACLDTILRPPHCLGSNARRKKDITAFPIGWIFAFVEVLPLCTNKGSYCQY